MTIVLCIHDCRFSTTFRIFIFSTFIVRFSNQFICVSDVWISFLIYRWKIFLLYSILDTRISIQFDSRGPTGNRFNARMPILTLSFSTWLNSEQSFTQQFMMFECWYKSISHKTKKQNTQNLRSYVTLHSYASLTKKKSLQMLNVVAISYQNCICMLPTAYI